MIVQAAHSLTLSSIFIMIGCLCNAAGAVFILLGARANLRMTRALIELQNTIIKGANQ